MTTIDKATLHLLQHQGRRMHAALHGVVPPDRKKAEVIQDLVDDILDRRPKVIAVGSDGEAVFAGSSPWVAAQATTAVNATDRPEPVLAKPVDSEPTGGGTAVLDRPPTPADQAAIDQARKEFGL